MGFFDLNFIYRLSFPYTFATTYKNSIDVIMIVCCPSNSQYKYFWCSTNSCTTYYLQVLVLPKLLQISYKLSHQTTYFLNNSLPPYQYSRYRRTHLHTHIVYNFIDGTHPNILSIARHTHTYMWY